MKIRLLFILLVIFVFISCDDDAGGLPSFDGHKSCHVDTNWDVWDLYPILPGQWEARKAYSTMDQMESEVPPGSDIIEFKENATANIFTIPQNYIDVGWSIQELTGGLVQISFISENYNLSTNLWMCDDVLMIGREDQDNQRMYVRID